MDETNNQHIPEQVPAAPTMEPVKESVYPQDTAPTSNLLRIGVFLLIGLIAILILMNFYNSRNNDQAAEIVETSLTPEEILIQSLQNIGEQDRELTPDESSQLLEALNDDSAYDRPLTDEEKDTLLNSLQ